MVSSLPKTTQTFLNSVLNAIPQPLFVKDSQHRWVEVNDAFCRLIGYSKEFLLGKSDLDIFPPEQAEIAWQKDELVFSSGQSLHNEEYLTDAQGTIHFISTQKNLLYDEAGEVYLVAVIQDITWQMEQDRVLQHSEATNRALLEAIPDLLLRVRGDGQCIDFIPPKNNQLCEALSETTHLAQIVPPETLHLHLQKIQHVLKTGTLAVYEMPLQQGGQQWFGEVRVVAFCGNEVLMMIRDITDHKHNVTRQAQAKEHSLRALAKEKELGDLKARFLTMISHEFRTPLTTIRTAVDLLKSFDLSQDEREELFQQIYGALEHTTQMMEDVLFMGRTETGQIQVHRSWFDVGQMCRKVITAAEINTGRCIQLSVKNSEWCDRVYLDEKLVRQILSNLVSNAIKYSPSTSPICLTIIGDPGLVTFHIQDYGIGIPLADQANLFDFFYRASNVGTISGTGVGLAIVKHCVDLHGGQITVESQSGQGTLFKVMLPTYVASSTSDLNG